MTRIGVINQLHKLINKGIKSFDELMAIIELLETEIDQQPLDGTFCRLIEVELTEIIPNYLTDIKKYIAQKNQTQQPVSLRLTILLYVSRIKHASPESADIYRMIIQLYRQARINFLTYGHEYRYLDPNQVAEVEQSIKTPNVSLKALTEAVSKAEVVVLRNLSDNDLNTDQQYFELVCFEALFLLISNPKEFEAMLISMQSPDSPTAAYLKDETFMQGFSKILDILADHVSLIDEQTCSWLAEKRMDLVMLYMLHSVAN